MPGQFKGEEKKPTIVLEGITDGERWLLFTFYGLPGTLNGLNVLERSTTMRSTLEGALPPRMKYKINGREGNLMYLLANAFYPKYAIFLQTITGGGS